MPSWWPHPRIGDITSLESLTTHKKLVSMSGMKARLLIRRRDQLSANAFVELVLWQLPKPLPGSSHAYKYRLAYVVDGTCVVRFDNERGKGDHKHVGTMESAISFTDPDELLNAFLAEIKRWNHENRDA